jgi:hypothetical protein
MGIIQCQPRDAEGLRRILSRCVSREHVKTRQSIENLMQSIEHRSHSTPLHAQLVSQRCNETYRTTQEDRRDSYYPKRSSEGDHRGLCLQRGYH